MVFVIGLISAAHISYAQIDTLLKYPYLYYYNWPESGFYFDSALCSLKEHAVDLSWHHTPATETAIHQHTDMPLEVIGVAYHTNIENVGANVISLYDSSMNVITRESASVYNFSYSWRTDTLFHPVILPGMYQSYNPLYGLFDCTNEIVLKYHFFNKIVSVTGDFWLGFTHEYAPMAYHNTPIYLVFEDHEEPFHASDCRYKVLHDSVWYDDSIEHQVPEVFLIINPQCNYVDSMTVTTDANGCAYVWWDNVPLQSQWQVNITGWNLDYTETVDTNYWHYCGLIPNFTYEIKIKSRCNNLYSYSWSEWSPAIQFGHYTPQSLESPQDINVTIVPNPASDAVTVTADAALLTLELRDLLGRTVLTQHPSASSTTVDVSPLPAGTYILRLHTPQGVATKKLVVSR